MKLLKIAALTGPSVVGLFTVLSSQATNFSQFAPGIVSGNGAIRVPANFRHEYVMLAAGQWSVTSMTAARSIFASSMRRITRLPFIKRPERFLTARFS